MEAFVIGVVVIITASTLAALGTIVARKIFGLEKLESFNDIAGNIFQVTGTLYAVLLGLIVVDVMNTLSEMRITIDQEASAVANIFILSRGLPSEIGGEVQKICANYVDTVIDEEWPAMHKRAVSKAATINVIKLWDAMISYKPEDDNYRDIRQMCIEEMSQMGDCRRKRIIASRHGVPPILWATILLGGFLTVAFTYFFGHRSLKGQIAMTVIVAISVSMNIYLVYLYGYPFSGANTLAPEGFMADRVIFKSLILGVDKLPNQPLLDLEVLKKLGQSKMN